MTDEKLAEELAENEKEDPDAFSGTCPTCGQKYHPVVRKNEVNKSICGEINARNCPIHQEAEETKPTKAREWWINIENNTAIADSCPWNDEIVPVIHVIEFSAYEEAQKKIAELESDNEKYCAGSQAAMKVADAYRKRVKELEEKIERLELEKRSDAVRILLKRSIASLKSQNAELIAALEFYADGNHIEVPDFKNNLTKDEIVDDGRVARDVLDKVRGKE